MVAFFMQSKGLILSALFLLQQNRKIKESGCKPMTTIRLLTSGQHLAAVQKVKLASGDVDSVFLDVSFDSSWDEFAARTAVFYTSQDDTVFEMLLVDNKCTVPHEVLAKECTLFIGIRAVTTDGAKIKTSSIVKLKIVQGANAAYTTISPTMDLYQQYLAAMREQIDPALTEANKKLDKHIEECEKTTLAEVAGVVLWTNPDETADFAAQKIEIDLTEYRRFHILFKYAKDKDSYFEEVCTHKDRLYTAFGLGRCVDSAALSDDIFARSFVISDTGIEFTVGKRVVISANHNEGCIPCEIIGYKH